LNYTIKIPTALPRDFFMKALFVLFFAFVNTQAIGQEVGQLKHYQRKLSLDTIQLPCERFSSQYFEISFPDSIYDAGTVSCAKLKYQDVAGFSYYLSFKKNTIQKVVIRAKGKKQVAILGQLRDQITKTHTNSDACKALATLENIKKRKARLTIGLNPISE